MSDRACLSIELPNGCGDNIQIVATGGGLRISIEEPWAGDTETGFGRSTGISLNHSHAKQILAFLQEWYSDQPSGDQSSHSSDGS